MKRSKKIIIGIVIVLLFFVGLGLGSVYYVLGGLTTTKLPDDNKSLGISEEISKDKGIQNIALYGVDDRGKTNKGRSDAVIVLSVNMDTGDLKMISILRDTKVQAEGLGSKKLADVYALGGPELAVKTLNQNFDLNIKEYVTVNFNQLAEVIDSLGGVTLNLTQAEVNSANDNIRMDAPGSPYIAQAGEILLTGDQAVGYARIRKIDSDNVRSDRQKAVLSAMLQKIQTMPKSDYPKFIREFLSIVTTSLDYSDLFALSPVMLKGNLNIEQYNIPSQEENPWGGKDTDGVWYWIYDLDKAGEHIHRIIYEDDANTTNNTPTPDTAE